jgi:hypothetical protein
VVQHLRAIVLQFGDVLAQCLQLGMHSFDTSAQIDDAYSEHVQVFFLVMQGFD